MTRLSSSRRVGAPAVGLIGAGAWGKNILRTLGDLGVLAACADTDPEVRAQVAQCHAQVRCFADYRELLAGEVPAVAVATPANSHYDIVSAALNAGKDVFVEKPLTLDPVQAEELRAQARRLGRVLLVGHLTLFQPAIPVIERYVASGSIGRIIGIHQERLGLGRPRRVENALWCLGSHDIALQLRLLGGVPTALQVQGQCIVQPHVEDDVYLHLTYAGGVQTHLHVSWSWPERRRHLTIVGSEGMLQYDELTQRVSLHRKTIGQSLEPTDLGEEDMYCGGDSQPLRTELVHFLDCVHERRLLDADIDLAVDVVRLLAAADSQLVRHTTHYAPPTTAAVDGHEAGHEPRVNSYL